MSQRGKMPLAAALLALTSVTAAWAAQPDAADGPPASPQPDWGLTAAAAEAARSISPRRLAAHVKFLSSDLLEGRGTGTRGGAIAADYIATQFALDGLKPAGNDGGYLQKIDFVGVTTEPATRFTLQPADGNPMPLKYGADFVTTDETGASEHDLDAPIVFVGYGIRAPEYDWDDFKGTDVRGKVLLEFVNEPSSDDPKFFDGPALTYYGRWTYKYEEAARLGAAGVLLIHREDLASYPWSVVRNSWSGEQAFLTDDPSPKLEAASWIQWDVAKVMFAAAGDDIDNMLKAANSRDFKPVELPLRLEAHIESKVRRFTSSNVLGIVPGREPGPPRQVVIYSAHYDHLGIVPGAPGADDIYNGAVDNATGVAVLLELAHAYSHAMEPPAHPILFASVTAEEKGLLGSEYLARHLPFPARDVTLDLNFDALLPLGIPRSVTVTGADRTRFYPTVERIARQFDLSIEPDANPAAGHYFRSDHFSFARVGIPAFSIGEGVEFAGHSREWGLAREQDYVAHHYHQPSDEYHPDWDFRGIAKLARFGLALGWMASAAPQPITWKPGRAIHGGSLPAPSRQAGQAR